MQVGNKNASIHFRRSIPCLWGLSRSTTVWVQYRRCSLITNSWTDLRGGDYHQQCCLTTCSHLRSWDLHTERFRNQSLLLSFLIEDKSTFTDTFPACSLPQIVPGTPCVRTLVFSLKINCGILLYLSLLHVQWEGGMTALVSELQRDDT